MAHRQSLLLFWGGKTPGVGDDMSFKDFFLFISLSGVIDDSLFSLSDLLRLKEGLRRGLISSELVDTLGMR